MCFWWIELYFCSWINLEIWGTMTGNRSNNAYEILDKKYFLCINSFQCIGKIFPMEFLRLSLKLHTNKFIYSSIGRTRFIYTSIYKLASVPWQLHIDYGIRDLWNQSEVRGDAYITTPSRLAWAIHYLLWECYIRQWYLYGNVARKYSLLTLPSISYWCSIIKYGNKIHCE